MLVFIGEYINGVRNGKGKEHCNGLVSFDGEYKDGKRAGKGKEYYYNYKDKIKFEGNRWSWGVWSSSPTLII